MDKANPLATILSAAMLLKYGLGVESAAKRIEAAVTKTLDNGFPTWEIYSPGTAAMARGYCAEEEDEKKLMVLIQSWWNSLYVQLCICWVLYLCTCTCRSILLCTCKIILMCPC